MRTKNSKSMTKAEAAHVAAVKGLPCSVCDAAGPSDAHHINQSQHFTVVALCKAISSILRMRHMVLRPCQPLAAPWWPGERRTR